MNSKNQNNVSMQVFRKFLMPLKATIFDALKTLAAGSEQIVLIVDSDKKLLGTVTDGDIRRGILSGYALTDSVQKVMNTHPLTLKDGEHDKEALLAVMVKNHIRQLPLVDQQGRVKDLLTMDALLLPPAKDNLVVIMSGGFGKRLKPLTDERPKPMLMIGGKPLLENNINKLKNEGFNRFCITVGYKADMITSRLLVMVANGMSLFNTFMKINRWGQRVL